VEAVGSLNLPYFFALKGDFKILLGQVFPGDRGHRRFLKSRDR
jgi:hypothetical protein